MSLLSQLNRAIKDDVREARERAHQAICESKMRFPTKTLARRYCKRAISKGADPRVHPYECHVCGKFHLTLNRSR